MENYDGFLNRWQKMERTNILPLRWIGNYCQEIAVYHLNKFLHYSDHDDYGLACRFHAYTSTLFFKPYYWWGTYYELDMDE